MSFFFIKLRDRNAGGRFALFSYEYKSTSYSNAVHCYCLHDFVLARPFIRVPRDLLAPSFFIGITEGQKYSCHSISGGKDVLSTNPRFKTMAHVIQYLRKSAHEGTKSVRDGFHSLITPVSSNEDPEPIASPLIGEDGGSGYGTPEEEEAPHHSHRGLGNSNLGLGNSLRALGFTDRYVDWTHSEDSIFRAKVAFAIYLIVAIILYSFILEEWSILDSVYFAVTVFTTVGK